MIRRALIIYCDNTQSGPLAGAAADKDNYEVFLQTSLGGSWRQNEIHSLRNPTALRISQIKNNFLNGADYTFVIFSGHGYTGIENQAQYLEVSGSDITLFDLRTNARRQTLLVDACRGFHSVNTEILKSLQEGAAIGAISSTRALFEQAVLQAEAGWSILFSADVDESAVDTPDGGAYLFSLIKAAEIWEDNDDQYSILPLDTVHTWATEYLAGHFLTNQNPVMLPERRRIYFPFAVKFVSING